LSKIEGNVLYFDNLDVLDGSPLLDIKPYVPDFDAPENARTGWLETVRGKVRSTKSDARFG
jgi:tRNA (Thr-GGU) A37 N-methylase